MLTVNTDGHPFAAKIDFVDNADGRARVRVIPPRVRQAELAL